jgi:acyl-coenzyme A thioesterase PaaI-like protein
MIGRQPGRTVASVPRTPARIKSRLSPATLRRGMNLWPPFLFAGIRVLHISDDWSRVRVRLHLRRWTTNYVGTQYGGSIFSMTDPFWMIMLLNRLGPGYAVWDKAAEIEFVAPGRTHVSADFDLDDERVEAIRHATAGGRPVLEWFESRVVDEEGGLVARVRKQVYVRRKTDRPGP